MYINPIIAPCANASRIQPTFGGFFWRKLGRLFSGDIFERSSTLAIPKPPNISSVADVQDLLGEPYYKITKRFLDSLSKKSYNTCIKHTSDNLELYRTGQEIAMYSEYIQDGIKNMLGNKKYMLIGIGQSPASILEYLKFKDVDTAIMPISSLKSGNYNELDEISKSIKFDTYLNYVKRFGFDIKNMNQDTTYIFTDYSSTGTSLRNFERLIRSRLPQNANCKFISLQKLARQGNLTPKEEIMIEDFETNILNCGYFKIQCSPIFKLDYTKLDEIEKTHQLFSGCWANKKFNILKLFFYDMLFKRDSKLKAKYNKSNIFGL
ncbi:MAG: hypothetical protein K6A44_00415 [bacterium]|nr:hypothetical protein [bacterium]